MRGEAILHLSDIHMGVDFGFPVQAELGKNTLIDIIRNDLEHLGMSVGLVIASGDFTSYADANILFNQVLDFLRALSTTLKLGPQHVIIVPGNHDLPFDQWDPTDYSHENAFNSFSAEFYGTRLEPLRVQNFLLPNGRPLQILPIHSVKLREPKYKQYGYVQWAKYGDFLLNQQDFAPETLRMAVLHHHLLPAPGMEIPDPERPEASLSLTLDAGEVIEGLQSHGFQVALHGHQHIPKVNKIARGRIGDEASGLTGLDDPLHVVAAGSLGARVERLDEELRDNTYSLLIPQQDGLRIRVRRFTPKQKPRDHFDAMLSIKN